MKKQFDSIFKNKIVPSKKTFDFNQQIFVLVCVPLWLIIFCFSIDAQTLAPGAPGKDAQWATAGKQGVGTSASLESKVWFTLAQGVLTEVYYPDVTAANVHKLEFIVVDSNTKKVETEQADAIHEIKVLRPDSLSFQQINTAKSGVWKITKTYAADVENNSVVMKISFDTNNKNLKFYLYYDPSMSNSGMKDTAWNEGNILYAQEGDKASALVIGETKSDGSFKKTEDKLIVANGFYQVNDGLEQLKKSGELKSTYQRAENGNVVQVAEAVKKMWARKPSGTIKPLKDDNSLYEAHLELILSFGKSSQNAFENSEKTAQKSFDKVFDEYEKGWSEYVKTLRKVEPKYRAQFNMAAMQLKALEDKTVRGANIASLTVPWGGDKNANENTVGGYHLIWSRDLYQAATAYMALGDKAAAERALDFLFKVQQKPDGSFPQNSFLDGKPFWGSLQLDEVAFPLILAYQLGKNDKATYENHVKRAADFIVKTGPKTPQERWEEEGGYSPSTIAAEIAGLVCAAEIARKNNDAASADLWLKTADQWQANIEKWTVTTNGKYSKEPYYIRITQNGKPDAGSKIELNNGAGFFDEREIVDAGFLELVRLGIKSPDDKIIQNSLKVIDEIIRVRTPNGDAFYRYNHDGYGEMDDGRRWNWDGKYTGRGRLWALLSGERGQYELALSKVYETNPPKPDKTLPPEMQPASRAKPPNIFWREEAKSRLDSMTKFANEGLMIPEQIWDSPNVPKNIDKQFVPELKFGKGTGSATPLAWSMAQFIRLAVNLQAGRNLDTPDVVYNRYVLGKKTDEVAENFKDAEDSKIKVLCEAVTPYLRQFGMGSSPNIGKKSPVIYQLPNNSMFPALFNYLGNVQSVEIVGDFTNWKPCGLKFVKNENLNIFILNFPNSARVEYKLIVDGKWIIDPLNPNKVDNGVGGENSFFTMPGYKPTTWDKGEEVFLANIDFRSKIFNGVRLLQIYNPVECVEQFCSTLYLQDGEDYIKRARAVQTQRNLVKAGKVKPFIIVFLDPKDRMKEYWASDDYAKFLAEEVVPFIDSKYRTVRSSEGRAIMGASLGGITSVHTALKYPETFGRVGGQSSSFWIDDERVVKELETLDQSKNKFKFYFDDGSLEGVEDSRKVVKSLKNKGYDVTYLETEAGHNWTAWHDRLADAFVSLWKN